MEKVDQLKKYIDDLVDNQKQIESIKKQRKDIEMKNLIIANKLSNIEPTKEILDELDILIKSIPDNINIDNLARFQLIRLLLLGYERSIIPSDEPPRFFTIMPISKTIRIDYGITRVDEIEEALHNDVEEIIHYLDLNDTAVKKRNKIALILYLKWGYPSNKLLRILGIKRARFEELISSDLPKLYMNIMKMKGIRRWEKE